MTTVTLTGSIVGASCLYLTYKLSKNVPDQMLSGGIVATALMTVTTICVMAVAEDEITKISKNVLVQ